MKRLPPAGSSAPTGPGAAALDCPYPGRPHRVYAALTNHCNRACPWCSTCSSPAGSTFLTLDAFRHALPDEGDIEVQLEGGEPTVHPRFQDFVTLCRDHPRVTRLVVSTNGVLLPRNASALRDWLARLGAPCTVKLSYNHHLAAHDAGLLDLAAAIAREFDTRADDRSLVLNVRLRPGLPEEEEAILAAVRSAGLIDRANCFHLQRYGFASGETAWEPPHLVGTNFRMINPDGAVYGPDLVARSEGMRALP